MTLNHRIPDAEWHAKENCKCPRCLYYWAGFERGRRMKNMAYKGFLISYNIFQIDNLYCAEALIDNGVLQKWIYPERDFLQQTDIKEHILKLAKNRIDNYIENG